jgi:hypothetical protein
VIQLPRPRQILQADFLPQAESARGAAASSRVLPTRKEAFVPLQLHLRLKIKFTLTDPEASTLAELLLQAETESIRVPLRTIAEWCGCSPSRARKVIGQLIDRDLVTVEHSRTATGFRATDVYRFAPTVLEAARRGSAGTRPRSGGGGGVHPAATSGAVFPGCKQERSLKTESKCSNTESEKTAGFDSAKNQGGLERCAPPPAPRPAVIPAPSPATCFVRDLKRRNLIKGIRSALPALPGFAGNWDAQLAADDVLRRAEAVIADWKSRAPADKKAFERMVAITRRYRAAVPSREYRHSVTGLGEGRVAGRSG